tara:strand:- start:406 stop:591 length:186 start_codon:yes stop_codon:yes gene_type:complete
MHHERRIASVGEQLGNRVDRNIRDARDRAHGRTLNQHVEDEAALFDGQLVHAYFHTELLRK